MWPPALILLFVVVHAAMAQPRWFELSDYSFDRFVGDFGRRYKRGSEQWRSREHIFTERLNDIRRHNSDPSQTWKRGINHFADWSREEWLLYNRAVVKTSERTSAVDVTEFTTAVPTSIDYRTTVPAVLTAVKNQGACGSCWAHSATESIETMFAIQFGQLPVLSAQQVTSCTQPVRMGCAGGSYASAFEAVSSYGGLNEEWLYGYTDFFNDFRFASTSPCRNITTQFLPHFPWYPKANVTGLSRIPRNSAAALMQAIAHIGPQSVSVASDGWSDYESGVFQNNYSSNITWQAINHDVQLVGYGHDFGLGVDYWIVRNSWGTNYGENGFIRLLRPKEEPCGNLTGLEICGTSGILFNPGYPRVVKLSKENDIYF